MQQLSEDLNINLSYLKPKREAENIIHEGYYIKHGVGVKGSRKIYETVEYDDFENSKIQELSDEVKNQKITLPEDWKKSDYLKMLYSGKFKLKDSIKKVQTHVAWRVSPEFHMLSRPNLEFLKEGILYIHGRDKQFRPIVILNAFKIDLKKHNKEIITQSLSFLLGEVKRYMMIPGKVENWIFMLETNYNGVFGLPLKGLGVIIDCMSVNFCGCLDKMYILNPSSGLNFMWNAIKGFIDAETLEKINFITQKNLTVLKDRISEDQLEKKYGGTQENLTVFWPPINLDIPGGYPTGNEREVEIQIEKNKIEDAVEIRQEKVNLAPVSNQKEIHLKDNLLISEQSMHEENVEKQTEKNENIGLELKIEAPIQKELQKLNESEQKNSEILPQFLQVEPQEKKEPDYVKIQAPATNEEQMQQPAQRFQLEQIHTSSFRNLEEQDQKKLVEQSQNLQEQEEMKQENYHLNVLGKPPEDSVIIQQFAQQGQQGQNNEGQQYTSQCLTFGYRGDSKQQQSQNVEDLSQSHNILLKQNSGIQFEQEIIETHLKNEFKGIGIIFNQIMKRLAKLLAKQLMKENKTNHSLK